MRYKAVLTRDLGKEASLLFKGVPQRAYSPSGCCSKDVSSGIAEVIIATMRRSQDEDRGSTQRRSEPRGTREMDMGPEDALPSGSHLAWRQIQLDSAVMGVNIHRLRLGPIWVRFSVTWGKHFISDTNVFQEKWTEKLLEFIMTAKY